SGYAKAASFLEKINYEITDSGCYLTARTESDTDSYLSAVKTDLINDGFRLSEIAGTDGLTFDLTAVRGNEYVYITSSDAVDKNDVIAFLDSALHDLTANKLRSKGNGAVVFICKNAEEDAVALSKAIKETYSGKRVLKLGIAIVETDSKKVYFRGNEPSVIQKLVTEYIMGSELPIKDEYKLKERLPFQTELEDKTKAFNLADYKKGIYNER
nr:hypothetical protein [Eubacterium sp.]